MRNNQPVTQKEVLYGDEESLISTTDLESRITYANEAFCKVAGFTEKELQGQHHNMVRHPDMPKQAFADLWEHIKAGKSWMGLVKNRCQNGDHYWVSAFVTPIRDSNGKVIEYQSVRSAPRSEWKSRAEKVYEGLRAGKMPNLMCLSCSAIGLGGGPGSGSWCCWGPSWSVAYPGHGGSRCSSSRGRWPDCCSGLASGWPRSMPLPESISTIP
ncbi:PAS domain-containing protein [Aeromonas schubertii]|uniref:Aerotaxis receptor Aer n=1 Tax=Aeromonas schubertii TaxID=652 RepID=A0A0S2SFL6_9GAMM|nr:PAS domain-containing protein [Aeromonas schubertii]ALP40473.1 aerotaxis receptor Aer [Aeromonas schubertii]